MPKKYLCCSISGLLILILFFSAYPQSAPGTFKKPKIALVLSGGGARGLAQIGILQSFEKQGFIPDLIVASSMGSIVGALYAAGYPADTIAAMAKKVDWDNIYLNSSRRQSLFVSKKDDFGNALLELRFDKTVTPVLPNAISHGQSFFDLLVPLLALPECQAGGKFDALPIPLRIIATDLISGKKVVLSKGNLVCALRASCAVPLAFTPVDMDSTLLIDGGISANIPVETAFECGADAVIAVDVTSPAWTRADLGNPVRLVDQIVTIGSRNQKATALKEASIVIAPDLGEIKNSDFHLLDSLIQAGYRCAEALSDSISNLRTTISTAATQNSVCSTAALPTPKAPLLRSIKVQGNELTRIHPILKAAGLQEGDTLTPKTLRKSISSLYATDLFENVNIAIDTSGLCRISVIERLYLRARFGLRFDEFHLGEGFVEPAFENLFGNGTTLLSHLQYGLRREKYTLEFESDQLFTRNIATNLHLQFYSSKERLLEVDTIINDSVTMTSIAALHEHTLRKTGSSLAIGTQLGRFSLLGAELKIERFRLRRSNEDVLNDLFGTSLKTSLPYLNFKLAMDSMDKFPFATSGTTLFATVGGATETFGGKYTFIKCTGTLGTYITVGKIHTFFPKFSFCYTNNSLPEVERAYIGGILTEEPYKSHSVYNYISFAGLPPRSLVVDQYAIFHMEYRTELQKSMYFTFATDWGPSWKITEEPSMNFRSAIKNAPCGISIGISYQSAIGPLTLSYGQLIKNSHKYLKENDEFLYYSFGYDF